jgi:N-acetylglucosamine-6-phosphate deacetylase
MVAAKLSGMQPCRLPLAKSPLSPNQPPPTSNNLSDSNWLIAPGLIDIQLNGAYGLDFTSDPNTIWDVAAKLPALGITTFLPTIITSPLSQPAAAQQVLQARPADFVGAEPIGLHFEGPFLNIIRKGAHPPQCLLQPDLALVADWQRAKGVHLVTLAPELPNAAEVITFLRAQGVVVSMGHSNATYQETMLGLASGANLATHLCNAMRQIEHREPGVAIASLLSSIPVGVIPDGLHLHPAMVDLIWRIKGAHQFVTVTDAMAALGMPPGQYMLGQQNVTVTPDSARLANGTLAGSILLPLDAIRNLQKFTDCSLSEAWQSMSATPAQVMDYPHKGVLQAGTDADFLVLTQQLELIATIIGGRLAFCASPEFEQQWMETHAPA